MGRNPRFVICYTLDGERRMTVSITTDKRAIAATLTKIYPGRRIAVVWLQWLDNYSTQQAAAWVEGGPVP